MTGSDATSKPGDKTSEQIQESTRAPKDFNLLGENPGKQLQILRHINERTNTEAERLLKPLTITVLEPEKPQARLERSIIAGTEYGITRGENGEPSEFTNKQGLWKRGDGKSDTWINTADKDHPRFMRGTPSIDENGNFRFRNSDFGTTETQFKDGRSLQEMTDAQGIRYALERDSKGKPTKLTDHTGSWTSDDGYTWSNEKGESRMGTGKINANGEYTFKENGKPESRAQSKELSEARALQETLSTAYGITFTPPDKVSAEGTTVQASARELRALESVIEKSKHVNLHGMNITFLGERNRGIRGQFGDYADNQLRIFQNSRINPESWIGLVGVGLHEIVHKEQDDIPSELWRGKNPGAEALGLRSGLGWDYHQKFGPVLLDKQGGMWSPVEDRDDIEDGPKTTWVWVAGTSPEGNKHRISAEEMDSRAMVRPATFYNSYPYETHAEAVAMYRSSPELLAAKSPEAYRVIRDWDQKRLNLAYGPNDMMRDTDGRIVRDNHENWRRRMEMERRFGIR